jgi:hypothetical protein
VAPPGNQAANREDKLQPIAMEGPGLLDNDEIASGFAFGYDPTGRFASL